MFTIHYKESISSTCELLWVSRQVYYWAIKSKEKRQAITGKVVELVRSVRIEEPRIGTRKLYYILQQELRGLGVGRDYFFAILKVYEMLIKSKRNYTITTNSYHLFKKHKNLIEHTTIHRP